MRNNWLNCGADGNHRFYITMLVLIGTSIALQVIIGVALLILTRAKVESYNEDANVCYFLPFADATMYNFNRAASASHASRQPH